MDNEVYDAGDQKQVKKRKTKAQLEKERNDIELETLINTKEGAYFIWRLLSQCGLYSATPHDRDEMSIHTGKREIGLWILAELVGINEQLYTKVRYIGSEREGE